MRPTSRVVGEIVFENMVETVQELLKKPLRFIRIDCTKLAAFRAIFANVFLAADLPLRIATHPSSQVLREYDTLELQCAVQAPNNVGVSYHWVGDNCRLIGAGPFFAVCFNILCATRVARGRS
jgi:hypothetical protein